MSEEEIKLSYVHVPIFYNAKPKTENVSNTIQETKNITDPPKDIPIPFGVLLILLAISILVLMFWRWE